MNTSSSSTGRAACWLRALCVSPLLIVAIACVAGDQGHSATPFDAVSSGQAPWTMMILMLISFAGTASYMFLLLILYARFIIDGSKIFSYQMVFPVLLLAGSYILVWYSDVKVRNEIAAAKLFQESIANTKWRVDSCGRRTSICFDIEGSLGNARIKSYLGNINSVQQELKRLQEALKSGESLAVEWGRAPVGWIAARCVVVGEKKLYNDWL